jgi:hypothetical protein
MLSYFFCSHKFHKIEYYVIFEVFTKKLFNMLSNTVYGFGILDPGSGKTIIRIPDPGSRVLKVNGSGSTTLILSYCFSGHRNEGGGHSCLTREDAG